MTNRRLKLYSPSLKLYGVSLFLLSILTFSSYGIFGQSWAFAPPQGFYDGVQAYRAGQFTQAETILAPLHRQAPDQSQVTYYLALVKTQLGQFTQAKTLYEEVTLLDPASEPARLSKIALQRLSNLISKQEKHEQSAQGFVLDAPPELSEQPSPGLSPSSFSAQTQQPAQSAQMPQQSQPNGFSQQDMMLMQMMMGNNGMSGQSGNDFQNGMGMMMPSMTGEQSPQGAQASGNGNIDPNLFSTMMMNQMLQNFNLDNRNQDQQ